MKRRFTTLLFALGLLATPGCYYGHLALGQTRVLWASTDIDSVLADPATPDTLRDQLALVREARSFASELGLEVGGQYTSYVPWPGDRIVTTVVATEPGSIEARGFRFPIVGRVPYKGFFDVERADAEARELRDRGLDVCVVAVPAYSTLGWLDDPITQPMLRRSDGGLVETVLHELVHATVFVKSQPDFNEGAANFVGEEASIRFFARRGAEQEAAQRARVADDRALAREIVALRNSIAELYQTPPADLPQAREQLEREARERIAALALQQRDASRLAEKLRLNDACLALRGTYAGDTPRHARVLASLGGDLSAYLTRLRSAAEAQDPRASFFAD